jgi:aminocarboxymuconate-semialdehyde decarboxylase
MASIAFTGCDVFYAAHGSAQPAVRAVRRREVVVNGRRLKTVDVHSHCVIPEALALLGLKAETQRRGLVLVVADRLSEMDEQGIDVEALSINPFWYKADRDVARQVIQIQNEKLAELCGIAS